VGGRHRAPHSRLPYVVALLGLVVLVGGALALASRDATEGTDDAAATASGSAEAGPAAEPSLPPATGSDAPEGAAPPEEGRGKIVIHGTGDVSLDPSYIPNLRTYGYGYAWSGLGGLFRRDDLTVVNLECAASDRGAPVPKEFNFRCDPAALPAMGAAGVEVANLGNNHAYDFGPRALVDARRNLRKAGIFPVGAGRDRDRALAPALFDLEGWKVAVVGLDQVVDPLDAVATATKPGTAAGHDLGQMLRAVRRADRAADIVVVMIHWGVELDTVPRADQVEEAHRLIDVGADIIFGGRPSSGAWATSCGPTCRRRARRPRWPR